MKIMNFLLKNSLFLNLFTFFILVYGTMTALKLKREAFPNINFDMVVIQTIYPGADPESVETYVTNLIEEELLNIDGIDDIQSYSRENVSAITIKLDPSITSEKKRRVIKDIEDGVDRIKTFPKEVTERPSILEIDSGVMPVMELTLSGDMVYTKLHKIAEELSEKISRLNDSMKPYEYGLLDKEYHIEIDARKLEKHHMSMDQVSYALARENVDLPGGVLRTTKGDFLVRTINKLSTTDDIESIVLRKNDSGESIKISDVGRAIKTFKDQELVYRTNGSSSITLIIRKSAEGDILSLVDSVKELVAQYKQDNKLEELEVAYLSDMSYFVRNRLSVLVGNGFAGMILVLITLLLFLSKGIAFVTVLGLPVAFLGSLIVMSFLGMTINLLTMFALVLVLGMLVDDSIVVAENIWQHYEDGKSPWDAVVDGTREVFWPVTSTILTTMAAFSPLLMVTGIFGKYISSMPKVVIISLGLSLLEAMFILPSHAYDILKLNSRGHKKRGTEPKKTSGMFDRAILVYGRILEVTLRLRYFFALGIMLVLGGSFWFGSRYMQVILFPEEGIETFYIRTALDEKVSLKETSEKLKIIEAEIDKNIEKHELISYMTYAGLQQEDNIDPFREQASHVGQIGVYLTPEKDRKRSANEIIETLRSKITRLAKEAGFVSIDFAKKRMGPPVGKPVAIQILGKDFNQMKEVSKKIQESLSNLEGVTDIKDSYTLGLEQITLSIDKEKTSQSLLSGGDVGMNVRRTLEGDIATYLFENGERIPVRIRYKESQRENEDYFKDILMRNSLNNLVPVKELVSVEKNIGPNSLKHQDGRRIITVTSAIDEALTSSGRVNDEIEVSLASLRREYPSLTLKKGGEYEETGDSMRSLAEAFLVALALIFLILVAQFKSLTQPIMVMMAIPFGFIGVIWAFYLHGMPLSFLGLIGSIGLAGVVVNDSIVLVDFTNHAIAKGMGVFDALVYAGKRRLRAVFLTSITTIAGVLPLVYGIGGSDEFLKPAALALGYGLLFSTTLVLLFIPSLYMIRVDILKLLRMKPEESLRRELA